MSDGSSAGHGVDVVVVGSANLDLVVQVPNHPRPGETVLGSGHERNPGGKGANQAVAAARLGASVAMVAKVGDDAAGRRLRDAMEADGVDTDAVATTSTPTGIALITVDSHGENAIVVSPGANDEVDAEHVAEHRGVVEDAAVCLLQLEVPDDAVVAAARAAGGTVVLNPAPARDLPAELLDATSVLVPNATELGLLAGADEPGDVDEAVAMAQGLAFAGPVVVTLGGDGACVVDGGDVTVVPAVPIDVVDTTAAGDAFCGAMAAALASGADLVAAVRRGVAAGACAASAPGAQPSLPDRDALEAMLARAEDEGA